MPSSCEKARCRLSTKFGRRCAEDTLTRRNKPKNTTKSHRQQPYRAHRERCSLSFCSTRRTTSNFEPVQRKDAIVFVLVAKQSSFFWGKIPFHKRITIYRPLSSDHFLRSFLSSLRLHRSLPRLVHSSPCPIPQCRLLHCDMSYVQIYFMSWRRTGAHFDSLI